VSPAAGFFLPRPAFTKHAKTVSNLSKILIGTGCTLCILLIAVFFFLRHLVTKSFPVTGGTVTVRGIHQSVDVYRDEFGIPHLRASDVHDLMFATGYVHAQDRLWQMELTRRAGEGRLSEIFDTATVATDELFRTLGLERTAETIERDLHPETRLLLEEYAAGVDTFIATHRGSFPVEFDMLDFQPEPWQVRHSILLSRLMAWNMNTAWWTDLTYAEIAAKVSAQKLGEILPLYPDSTGSILYPKPLPEIAEAARKFHGLVRSYRDFMRLGPLASASNAWVVGSWKSLSGKPLLANDPHLSVSLPSHWYEMHLSAPGWNVSGMTLPGVPFIVIGHNDSLAWGMTNAMLDDADFYVEQLDSARPGHYRYRNSSLPIQSHEELIRIGRSDSITITVRSTHHGPIINDVHPTRGHAGGTSGAPIALRWTGLDASDEAYGFSLMNRARNSGEFQEALTHLAVPGQCIVYADARGNTAFWLAAHVPVRGKGNPALPLGGSGGESEWLGYVPFGELPKLWNPPGGFIVSANQKITNDAYPHYLSTLWEPPYRYRRIEDLLAATGKFSAEDFQQIQQDIVTYHGREILPFILKAFERDTLERPGVKAALEYLRNWDYRCTQYDIATTVFNEFWVRFLHDTYEDEMGPDVFGDFLYYGAIPYRVTSQLIAKDSSAWFDDVSTPQIETRDDIIRRSLVEAIGVLSNDMGLEMKNWQWGKIHTVVFSHPFSRRKPLDRVFNAGPFPTGGSATTINKADYRLGEPFAYAVGVSMRQIVDLASPARAFTVIPLGQSGQPLNAHYDDQVSLWLNGGYHRITIDWSEMPASKYDHLILSPGR